MHYTQEKVPAQRIIGISVKTENSSDGFQKIKDLWARFYGEKVVSQIPGKISDDIFAVYTDYEKDHTKPYTLIVGVKVEGDVLPPEGMDEHVIPKQTYAVFTVKGEMPQAIIKTWKYIWSSDLKRKYSTDFEHYIINSDQNLISENKIYIAIK